MPTPRMETGSVQETGHDAVSAQSEVQFKD